MKKKLIALVLAACVLAGGCGSKPGEKENEWTYEKLENELGGIITIDLVSVRDCLNEISWHDYYFSGIVVETNSISRDILTLCDDSEGGGKSVIVSQGEENQYFAEKGETVYVKAQNIQSLDDDYYLSSKTTNLSDGYISCDKKDEEYVSIHELNRYMDKIYKDTYFKTEGIVIQDGEDFDGNPEYYLYPSEESYKEDKFLRLEISFLEEQSNIVGKTVTIIGNPDKNASYQGLTRCSIVEE